MRSSKFTEEVDALIAVTGELTLDEELIEATRKLRRLAVEADSVDVRFREAMLDVRALLEVRMGRTS